MKIFRILAVASVALLLSCNKQTQDLPRLRLNTTVVTADISGGDKTLSVSASGAWTAEFEEEVDWVSLSSGRQGEGNGEIVLHFEPNSGDFRFVYLKVSLSGTDLYKMVSVNQEAVSGSPIVRLTPVQDYFPAAGGAFELGYFSNKAPQDLRVELEPEVDWVTDIYIGTDRLSFKLSENVAEVRRSVVLTLYHQDASGVRFIDKCTLTQKPKAVIVEGSTSAGHESYGTDSDGVAWI